MPDYPTVITPEILEKYTSIPDEEVVSDIRETEREIYSLEIEVNAYRDISEASLDAQDRKMASFRESAKRYGIQNRKEFVVFLKSLLKAREVSNVSIIQAESLQEKP